MTPSYIVGGMIAGGLFVVMILAAVFIPLKVFCDGMVDIAKNETVFDKAFESEVEEDG
jgi:hypothetical protein